MLEVMSSLLLTHALGCGFIFFMNGSWVRRMKHILGEISKDVVEQWGLQQHEGKKIVMYPDRKRHSKERHLKDFGSLEYYYFVMNSLESIIQSPDYVYYNSETQGLEYYKNLPNNVVIAVRISDGNELKVRSIYPVEPVKIENRKKKEEQIKMAPLIEKYRYKQPN